MVDSVNGKTLNTKKLLKSSFIDRFIGFIEAFDEFRDTNILESVMENIDNKDYSYIRHFLYVSSLEYIVPFSIHQFISLSKDELVELQDICVKISAFLDEKNALYQELLTFYE